MPLAFLLKKLVTTLFFPLTWCWLALLGGFVWFARRRARDGMLWTGIPLALLWIGSCRPLADGLLGRLEDACPPLLAEAVERPPEWIVVLGGGSFHPNLPGGITSRAQDVFWIRLSEGARLARAFPESRLLVSLSTTPPSLDVDAFLADYAGLFGIGAERIEPFHDALDTGDEARLVRALTGEGPGIVATSAFHMPRALRQFRDEGLDVLPAPCGYLARGRRLRPSSPFPDEEAWLRLRLALKEYLGLLQQRLGRRRA